MLSHTLYIKGSKSRKDQVVFFEETTQKISTLAIASLHDFVRLILALSPSRLTKSKIQAICLHEQLYEPNRQISRSLFTFSPYAYTLMWGLCPTHPRPKPLPKSKGS
ncbi:hypothetical protein, partial [Ectobacillus funiculus]|uniref:hypothetical protein n=1 Tax=Ectobacillus funiculus TaxID=137993 RepID=UPI00196B7E4E